MKGRENMPVQATEEKVRDAFRDAAQTLTAEDLPGLPSLADRPRATRGPRAPAPRARIRTLVPLAAAAGVAAVAVTTALVVPALQHEPAGGHATGPAGAPAFFAGITELPVSAKSSTRLHIMITRLNIYRSTTGQVIASVRLPRRGLEFEAVASLGSDRTYVAAAESNCTTWLYRFSIDGAGRPGRLTPLGAPRITGSVLQLSGSTDGNVLAYTAGNSCTRGSSERAGVIHLATGQVTTWTYVGETAKGPTTIGGLSLTADGSTLGITFDEGLWTLPTNSPAGPLTRHARKVPQLSTGVFTAVLTNTGSQVYVETGSIHRGPELGLYSIATGKQLRTLGRIGPGGRKFVGPPLVPDADGTHLLMYGYIHYDGSVQHPAGSPALQRIDQRRMAEMNLVTGHLTWITSAVQAPVTELGFSTVAW